MPLVRVDVGADAMDDPAMDVALASLPQAGRIVVMLHGYRFSPFDAANDPHRHILSFDPDPDCWKAVSWPDRLGVRADDRLGIAFGWHGRGSIWTAHAEAARAGASLAALVGRIRLQRPGQAVDVVAHSLGARVVLAALPCLDAGAIGRAVLIAGAEYISVAEASMASPAGNSVEILNVTARSNIPFDRLLETCIAPPRRGDRALGAGAALGPRWLDLPVDDGPVRAALLRLGHSVAPPERRVCHWSGYIRPGLFGLYRAFLDDLDLERIRAALPQTSRQTSRRRARSWLELPLPWAQNAAS